jgi:hypothetical protein
MSERVSAKVGSRLLDCSSVGETCELIMMRFSEGEARIFIKREV